MFKLLTIYKNRYQLIQGSLTIILSDVFARTSYVYRTTRRFEVARRFLLFRSAEEVKWNDIPEFRSVWGMRLGILAKFRNRCALIRQRARRLSWRVFRRVRKLWKRATNHMESEKQTLRERKITKYHDHTHVGNTWGQGAPHLIAAGPGVALLLGGRRPTAFKNMPASNGRIIPGYPLMNPIRQSLQEPRTLALRKTVHPSHAAVSFTLTVLPLDIN